MARSGTVGLDRVRPTAPVALRCYLARRSALELVGFDALVIAGLLWVTLPAALSMDAFWLRILLAVSPSLLLIGRSLVVAAHVPALLSMTQLDPAVPVSDDPRLAEARHLTWVGVILLVLTVLGAAALVSLGLVLSLATGSW